MKKILLLTINNIDSNPRPNRLIKLLNTLDYKIDVASPFKSDLIKNNLFLLKPLKKDILQLFIKGLNFLFQTYKINNNILINEFIDNKTLNELKNNNYDLIICCNLEMLPLAVIFKKENTKILFDVREYFIKQFKGIFWNIFIKPNNSYILAYFKKNVDKFLTVSNGLKVEYLKNENIDCEVYMSLPEKFEFKSEIKDQYSKIKLVHHGIGIGVRKIENMIYLMDNLDSDKYELDLYLVNKNNRYFKFLKDLASIRKNVNILEPVKFNEINKMLSKYDIGLIHFEPITFNLEFSLPNKFFEFIQSGLCLAFSPSPDMKYIIDEYKVGVTSDNYEPKNLAEKISNLSIEEINKYKENSRKAAEILNVETNNKRMKEIIEELIGN